MREFRETDGSAVYLKVIVFLLAANIVAGILASAVQLSTGYDLLHDSLFNYAAMTVFQIGNAAVVLLHIRRRRQRPDIFFGRVRPETPVIGVLAGAVCLFGFYGLAAAFDTLLTETGYVGQTGHIVRRGGGHRVRPYRNGRFRARLPRSWCTAARCCPA